MVRWLAAAGLTLLTLGAITAVVFALLADPPVHRVAVQPQPRPGSFYAIPAKLPKGPPGTIIRRQPLRGLPRNARGWRILYVSHGYNGERVAVSGLVIVPGTRRPKHHRKLVVFAHPTTGIASQCGLSVLGGAAARQVDGLGTFLHAGDAVVIPDYQGLGTPGPHPYLIGKVTARNTIDAVRAMRKIHAVHAGRRYAVYGESEGAQAAIALGQLAPQYGRGLELVGIAAAGPPVSLASMFARGKGTPAGDVLAAYTLSSWSQVYNDTRLENVIADSGVDAAIAIDKACVPYRSDLPRAVPAAVIARMAYHHKNPTHTKAWSKLLSKNSLRPFTTPIPILITQGQDDQLVVPQTTEAYVRALCERADTVGYRVYPDTTHAEIGSASANFVSGWIAGRFAGRPPLNSCPS
jgi:pimeloyl-ACP methyl ester carboxylesterase